ncbi:MAG: sigma-70 family RNA polymerase sigma factor [Microcoleaceae cyanobacterium]
MPNTVFSEVNHPLIKAILHHSDQELLTLYQNYPDQGKYFTAIFCRYGQIVQTLINHSVRSPVQSDYLFAESWRDIFHELRDLDLRQTGENLTLQNWLINHTAILINSIELPPVESIHYSLKQAPVPFWCYLWQGIEQLPPLLRLIILMAQTFHWSETRIAAYLQAEGETLSPAVVKELTSQGYQDLQKGLPADIQQIYLH